MKKPFQNPYFKWGTTAFAVIVLSICFFFSIFKMDSFFSAIRHFLDLLKPFIYGAVVAYLMLPIYNTLVSRLRQALSRVIKSKHRVNTWSKVIASISSVLLLLALISALLSLVLPQFATSILSLTNFMPSYLVEISSWLEGFLRDSPVLRENLMQIYSKFTIWMTTWMQDEMLPKLIQVMGGSLLGTVNMLKNVVVGIIIAIYILISKDLFAAQAKKLAYSLLRTERANLFIRNMRYVHRVFGSFILGNLLDSLIIGMMTFVFMHFFNMPYVILISVIIGVTNFIPFFGPFIGAVPSALLVLMIDPVKCIYFIIFIFILQQIDGNVLKPKILGDSTGLSGFWVMFAILIGGGLFGFAGMVLGVPLFAVFYSLITSLINRSLSDKNLPVTTNLYFHMDHIDPVTRKPVPFPPGKPVPESSISLKQRDGNPPTK